MTTYVMVHGAWHGAWCWERVTPLLASAGHDVVAVDLPGHGASASVGQTLDAYAAAVVDALVAAPGPVVVVAHSMGGVVASQAAELAPDNIARLVYVCGFLPTDGQALVDIARGDRESQLFPHLVIDQATGMHWVNDAGRAVFYDDCPAGDAERAAARLVKEPLAPLSTPVRLTAARFGRVPRAYVKTSRDRVVSPALQQRMIDASPCADVVTMPCGHSPFYAAPDALAAILATFA